jgi:DNA replication protein DnaC
MSDAKPIGDVAEEILERWNKFNASLTPEERAKREQQSKNSAKEQHARDVQQLRYNWNAPNRQLSNKEIDRTGAWGKKESELQKMIGTGFLVALVGGRGPGKTQMGVELMKHATEKLKSAYYDTLTGLFLEIKSTFKKDSLETEEAVVRKMVSHSFLVIDEVGRKSDGEWENRIFFEIVDRRYREMRDTLLIANHTKEQFLQTIGESLASRMQETGGIVECTWESYRI